MEEKLRKLENKTAKFNAKKDNFDDNIDYYMGCCNEIVLFYKSMNKNKKNVDMFFEFIKSKSLAISMCIRSPYIQRGELKETLLDILHTSSIRKTNDKFDNNLIFMASMVFLNFHKNSTINVLKYDYNSFKILDTLYTDDSSTVIMLGLDGRVFRRRNSYSKSNKMDYRVKVKKDTFQEYLISLGCFECPKGSLGYLREINIIDNDIFNEIRSELFKYEDYIMELDFDSYSLEHIKDIQEIKSIVEKYRF